MGAVSRAKWLKRAKYYRRLTPAAAQEYRKRFDNDKFQKALARKPQGD